MKTPATSPRLAPNRGANVQKTSPVKRQRGWHCGPSPRPPRLGKGSATVEPIRELHDIAKIKGYLAETPRDLSIFVVGIHVGLRGSDLLALRWSDVIDEDGRFAERLSVRERKTGNTRHVTLQEKVKTVLANWRRISDPMIGASGLIWPGKNGSPLTIQRLHQLVNEWCSAAGLRGNFGTHTLRKTYGYHLRRLGYDIELLMKIFGHSSASITLRYIGVEQEDIDEANLKLVL